MAPEEKKHIGKKRRTQQAVRGICIKGGHRPKEDSWSRRVAEKAQDIFFA